jgi:tellurite resistance protein TerC
MDVAWWHWGAFAALVVALLAVDLLVFARRDQEISFRRVLGWSIGWTALGVAFAGVILLWQGGAAASEYLTGFVIEKSLSIDNLFVFALVFAYFGVPAASQRRVLIWGIVGAIVLRAIFIFAGAALLDAFHYTVYVFGGFLVLTGLRMTRHSGVEIHPERNPALTLLGRVLPLARSYDGERFVIREQGRRFATPLAAALVLVATFDLVFAVDSIPAIFAVTRETFLVCAANAFSLLGLASLYFVLAELLGRFHYLNVGLGLILVFVGTKMAAADLYELPVWASLVVIAGVLGAAVGASLVRPGPYRPAVPMEGGS